MGNKLNCTRVDRGKRPDDSTKERSRHGKKHQKHQKQKHDESTKLLSPPNKRHPFMKKFAPSHTSKAASVTDNKHPDRDRLLNPRGRLQAYDSLWDMSQDSDDDDSKCSSGIASRASTCSSGSRSSAGASSYRTARLAPISPPLSLRRPVTMETPVARKHQQQQQSDANNRLSWTSEYSDACTELGNTNSRVAAAPPTSSVSTSRTLSPWRGEYVEASTREKERSAKKGSRYYQSPDGTFDFSFSALREEDEDVGGDKLLSRCLDRLDRVLMQALEVLCHELDPELTLQVLQRRHLFNDGQQLKGRQRNRQQLAEAALTALSRQTTSVILEACGEILDKCCNTNKTLRAFIEALLCLFNFIVRYTVAAEFVSRQLLHQPNGNNNNNSNSSYHLAASLQQGQGSDSIAANLDNDKPLADIKLLYLDTNCDKLRPAVDTMAIKKRKLMHDAFFDRKSSVHHEADKYIPVISLALFSFSLGQSEAEELQKILHLYPKAVAEISLKKCSISDATWQHVFAGIGESAKSLQTLDLHLSAMPDNAVPRLSRSLRAMSSLRQLNVAGVTSSKDCLAAVVSSLVNCHQLTNLDLSFCPVEDRGAHLLAELLERGGCPLVTLRLRSTQIRRDGARKLLTALKKHPRLTHFDIGGNRIGTGALGLLGEHLIYNRSMREITADDCGFSSEGCDALSRALKSNSVLQHLDISRNRIGDSGSNLIADSLRYNTSLVSLGLNFCDVSNQGFSSLLDSLLSNVRLATLKLCYNQIGGRSYEGVVERSQSPCFSGDSDIDRESGLGRSTDESQFGEVDTTKIVSHDIQYNSTGVVGIFDGCYVNNACMTTPKQSPLIGSSLRNVTTSNSSSNNGSYLNFDSDVNIYSKLTFVLQQNKTVKILLWGNNIESLDI